MPETMLPDFSHPSDGSGHYSTLTNSLTQDLRNLQASLALVRINVTKYSNVNRVTISNKQ